MLSRSIYQFPLCVCAIFLSAAAASAAPDVPPGYEVKVYDLPDGARPHDVAPAPDGKVWYTAQREGALGILDPATGKAEHVSLGEKSSPHGVIQGPDGAAWITDSGLNAIVRFDPRTREVKRFPLPGDTGYTNLNTGAFDGAGILWFTGQNGVHGSVDPRSGTVKVWKSPRGRGPYGIAATPDGRVFYASLAGSHIAEIDTKTGEVRVIEPPTERQGARRVWSDSKGNIWVAEWNSGNLSRYTPATGAWKAWRAPGERPQVYAVYVDERDIVWASEWSANATLAFDPATETFQSFPGSGPRANVRQILGRPGEVWLPESGRDRLMVIRTKSAAR